MISPGEGVRPVSPRPGAHHGPNASTINFATRAFRVPRIWSNRELSRFAPLYTGEIINVSAWQDKDKEGSIYKKYFSSCKRYMISNFDGHQGGLQGWQNEIFLDLEKPVPEKHRLRYDVVFNHTTLEHVWDFHTAVRTLTDLSRDTVILVVPWLQPLHTTYGDYWRFSPHATARLLSEQGFTPLYLSWNTDRGCAIYVFCIASRHPEMWQKRFDAFGAAPDLDVTRALEGNFAGKYIFDAADAALDG